MYTTSNTNILILGASTRAAAFSTLRAGFRPRCIDQYADADLAAVAPSTRFDLPSDEDQDGLALIAAAHGRSPWFYTGSFENHPALVDRLTSVGRLLGNDAETLQAVRDPWRVADSLACRGLAAPALLRTENGPPPGGRWLVKPTASAGGRSIDWADARTSPANGSTYYQNFIDGPTFSALYIAAAGRAWLIGVVRQHQGVPGAPFLYRGGIGPWSVSAATTGRLRRIGAALAADFRLVGLFGVDFVLKDDEPWTVEVNPRYTASVEILELATRRALILDHVAACVEGRLSEPTDPSSSRIVGKRILYAPRRIAAPEIAVPAWSVDEPFAVPPIADVPWPKTPIGAIEPIMTVLATASTAAACAARLDQAEAEWMERLERLPEE